MRSPSDKDFSVYSFSAEDEAVERATTEALLKFGMPRRNPKTDSTASTSEKTFDFLEVFGGRTKSNHSCKIDTECTDRIEDHHLFRSQISDATEQRVTKTTVPEHVHPVKEIEASCMDEQNYGCETNGEGQMMSDNVIEDPIETSALTLTSFLPGNSKYVGVLSELPCDLKQSDSRSNSDDSRCLTPSSSSQNGEHEGPPASHNLVDWAGAKHMDIDGAIIVSPDYAVYRDEFYAESQLTFSVDSLRIECSDASRDDGPLIFEWSIANILFISRYWSGSVETAFIEVQLKETNSNLPKHAHESDFSGIAKLTFTVCGSYWLRKEQKIRSLAPKYEDLWKTEWDSVKGSNLGGSIPYYPRHQLNVFEETLEDIIYPQGDPDAVSISRRDVELLRPETFINDTIIDFYIKYLKDKIETSERNRFHFFNSFFFRKLADLDKYPKCVVGGRAAFLRVRKWTRKVNIFEKDYIFIPVNFNLHWSLLVICHPGEIASYKDEDIHEALRLPCILHMDSIKGSHSGLKGLIQSYLWEEWKERHPESSEIISSNFLNLRFVPLELPQQENYFDCGLFLLHYAELFLKTAPINFSPFNITSYSNFLTVDWFVPAEASFKRFLIRNVLYELLGNSKHNDGQPELCGKPYLLPEDYNVNKKSMIGLLSEQDTQPANGLGNSAVDIIENKIELELYKESSEIDSLRKEVDPEQQFFEPKAIDGTCPHQTNFAFETAISFVSSKCMMPPILEDADDLVHQETLQTYQTINGRADEDCSTSFSPRESNRLDLLGTPKGLVAIEEDHENSDSLRESTTCILIEGLTDQFSSKPDGIDHSGVPCKNSETPGTLLEVNIHSISSDDCELHLGLSNVSSSGEAKDSCAFSDPHVSQLSNPEELNLGEEKVESLTAATPETLETCVVDGSRDAECATNPVSSLNDIKDMESKLPEECEVVLDSPDRKPVPMNSSVCPGSVISISSLEDTSADGCHPISLCMDTETINDVSYNEHRIDNEDVVILNDQLPRKRQKLLYTGTERRQTRSVTRNRS